MPDNNLLQADVPRGATLITQTRGTAPGLICPVGQKVVYAVPGVPYEMTDMFERAILPDLVARVRATGTTSVILSRVLRTWGASESALAESVSERFDALANDGHVTIAFLASGIEGIKVRLTARGDDEERALALLDDEETRVRAMIVNRFGDIIFGTDDETMEDAVASRLLARELTLAVAESVTGGLIASRLVNIVGRVHVVSRWRRELRLGREVRRVGCAARSSGECDGGRSHGEGVRTLLASDVGLSVTGVAGPEEQDGQPAGTVFVGIAIGERVDHVALHLPGRPPSRALL